FNFHVHGTFSVSGGNSDFSDLFKWYLGAVRSAQNEDTKADRFRDFIRRAFPEIDVGHLGGYYPELEKYIKYSRRGRVIKGRPDSLFGSLVIEFERVLDDKHLREAQDQLKRYIAALWSIQAERGQKRGRFTAIATDGLKFIVYKPRAITVAGPIMTEQVLLEEIDKTNLEELSASEAYDWLNRYIIVAASELKPVDPDEFAKEFGVGSRVFREAMKLLKGGWKKAKDKAFTLYKQWDSHLRIVYGSKVASEELYLKHTYLATLAKLVVYASYSGGALPISREELVNILNGSIFRQWRIINFIEEDLFSWVHNVREGIEVARLLVSKLSFYDLSSVTIDVFKELYQRLVDPEARHDLGEYYTPDWLAEMMVSDLLSDNPYKSVLDPACGSGTFLAMAIAYKKREIRDLSPQQLLKHILENVIGIDIHPLAMLIARATYLVSLGRELLEAREGDIMIPVYLADSIRLPEEKVIVFGGVPVYSIKAESEKELVIPSNIALNPTISDLVIDAVKDYAASVAEGAPDSLDLFDLHLSSYGLREKLSDGDVQALHYTTQNMIKLIKMGKDTIWGFILKNYYKPVFFARRKFDVIVGNPPWLSIRDVKSEAYLNFLKTLISQYGILASRRPDILWATELAVLFIFRVTDLYLADNGEISFVMPRSIITGEHHHGFRTGNTAFKLKIIEIIDLEKVSPLFNMPACILKCRKGRTSYPIKGIIYSGHLPRKNVSLGVALKYLNVIQTEFHLHVKGTRSILLRSGKAPTIEISNQRSLYYDKFKAGACLDPRPFWFIDIKVHPKLGINPRSLPVETSSRAIKRAKSKFKDVKISGSVESKFLFGVLTGSELVPFGNLTPRLAILPIEARGNKYRVITATEAKKRGYLGLAKWLSQVERIWHKKLGAKASKMTIYEWLNYWNQLASQNPTAKYKTIYTRQGTYLASCVLKISDKKISLDGIKLRLAGVIADITTVWLDIENEDEA
ncbi:hypothetical protein DRO64_08635, partial [Candidatus Bathyarchaeota archaeon]